MALYVVSYDLRREVSEEDYRRVHDALRTAVDYCWPLESFWIIETPLTPGAVIQVLLNVRALDEDDGIVVLEITGRGNFRRVVNKQTADWLNSRIIRT